MLFTTLQKHSKQILTNYNATPFKGDGKKCHFVYVIQNTANNMLYIGKRSSRSLDDGYLGSGKEIISAKAELGEDVFQRKELSFFQNEQEALVAETLLLKSEIVQGAAESFYNLQGFDWDVDTFRQKKSSKQVIAHQDDIPRYVAQAVDIELCFNESLKVVCRSFVDAKGVRWFNATDVWKNWSYSVSKRISIFLLHDNTKKFILHLTNNQHLKDSLIKKETHRHDLPPEILAIVSYSAQGRHGGTYFCQPLFLKYCGFLSPDADVAILSGVNLQIKELPKAQLSLDI